MLRSRPSRRSACDRCRHYKLRCDRSVLSGSGCERCLKLGIVCTTTPDPSQRRRSQPPLTGSSFPPGAVLAIPRDERAREPEYQILKDARPQHSENDTAGHMSAEMAYSHFDLAVSNFPFDEIVNDARVGEASLGSSPVNEGTTFSDAAMRPSTSCATSPLEVQPSPLKELLELSNTLLDDSERLTRPVIDPVIRIGDAVQRVLDRSSHFSDVAQSIAAGETQEATQSSTTTRSSERKKRDIILTTTLVTTYLLILRAWRFTLSKVYQFQLKKRRGETTTTLHLPSLTLGGFELSGDSDFQVLALLELASSMLQVMDSYLGIGEHNSCNSHGRSMHTKLPTLIVDPVDVSLRETMLSQERLRIDGNDGLMDGAWRDIIDQVKKQLIK